MTAEDLQIAGLPVMDCRYSGILSA